MTDQLQRVLWTTVLTTSLTSVPVTWAEAEDHVEDPADEVQLIQRNQPPPDSDDHFIMPGTTRQIARDFSSPQNLANTPDYSYASVWVRMFPLLSVPGADPYPVTSNRNLARLYNSGWLEVYNLNSGEHIGSSQGISFNFANGTYTLGSGTKTLGQLWITPRGETTTTMSWDHGISGKEIRVELRGGFAIKETSHGLRFTTEPDAFPMYHSDEMLKDARREYWSIINVVTVNEYLRAVVPSEAISSWHPEALRTQAIAARTYGLFEMARAREQGRNYDVDPTTWYQSYRGIKFWKNGRWEPVEMNSTSRAVESTRNEVVISNGEIIKAYFSATSGGRTCTSSECFRTSSNPSYLQEVDDAPGIRQAPGGTWGARANITATTIHNKLRALGIRPAHPISKLQHWVRGPSNRTWQIKVLLRDGSTVNLNPDQTRSMNSLFGSIRSYLYELGDVGSSGKQEVVGHGYGHGVGMSQWGAQLFAQQGWDAHRILLHFYSNSTILDLSALQ